MEILVLPAGGEMTAKNVATTIRKVPDPELRLRLFYLLGRANFDNDCQGLRSINAVAVALTARLP